MDKYICIRSCFYMNHLWKKGDVFNVEGAEPNKHFALNGIQKTKERVIYTAGDDKRSTKEMHAILEKTYGVKDVYKLSRKEAFKLLMEKEGQKEEPIKKEIKAPAPPTQTKIDKLFSNMTPDEIAMLTVPQIKEHLKDKPYSLDFSGYVTKADLIKHAIKVEEQIKMNALT